jgi:hypothetical protein
MAKAIFIGYRRQDTAASAERLYDALCHEFGRDQVFKDVDSIPVGTDFAAHIRKLTPKCRVFLALIGDGWLDAQDERGARRLDDPCDLVRIEIEMALRTPRLVVVPTLVGAASMPHERSLPASIRRLTRLHAARLRSDPEFQEDVQRLARALREHVRTGRLDLKEIGGPARMVANAAGVSGWVIAAWLAATGALVSTAVPPVRDKMAELGGALVERTIGQDERSEATKPAPPTAAARARDGAEVGQAAAAPIDQPQREPGADPLADTVWAGELQSRARMTGGLIPFTMRYVLEIRLNGDGSVDSNHGPGRWSRDGQVLSVAIGDETFVGDLNSDAFAGRYMSADYEGTFQLTRR